MNYPRSATIGNLEISPPWGNASGFLATPPAQSRFAGYNTGMVVGKTILLLETEGNETPICVEGEDGIFYNAVGLAGPGVDKYESEMRLYYPLRKPLFVSVASKKSAEELAEVIRRLEGCYDGLEVNGSCHNVSGIMACQDPKQAGDYTKAARAAEPRKPVVVKLTPDASKFEDVARAIANEGADGLLAINTIKGIYINPHTKEPHLTFKTGGRSGHNMVKEEGLRRVAEIARIRENGGFNFAIGGVGGIGSADFVYDSRRYFDAGADYIEFGTRLFLDRPLEKKRKTQPDLETVQEFLERMEREIYEITR